MASASSTPPVNPVIEGRVQYELTRLLYRVAGFGLFSNIALAFVLAAGMSPFISPPVAISHGWRSSSPSRSPASD